VGPGHLEHAVPVLVTTFGYAATRHARQATSRLNVCEKTFLHPRPAAGRCTHGSISGNSSALCSGQSSAVALYCRSTPTALCGW